MKRIAVLAAIFTLSAQAVSAEPDRSDAHYSVGARVGGYGFRNTQHAELERWDDCRMDGMGIFAQRTFTPYLFAEAGFDFYTASDAVPEPGMTAPHMDRISGVTTVAGGARIPWRWLSPYLQVGLGMEITRVEMASHGLNDRAVLPMGFLGVGADLRITRRLSVGANARTNLMKHFVHGADLHTHDDATENHTEMEGEFEAAAQGQIFVRYER